MVTSQHPFIISLLGILLVLFSQTSLAKPTPQGKTEAVDYAISLKDFLQLKAKAKIVVIDVRKKSLYTAFHIDGSINMAPHEIKTKAYFKNRPVLLVGNGYDEPVMQRLVAALTDLGFKQVSYLQYGIIAWQKHDRKNSIAPNLNKNLYYVHPRDLYAMKSNDVLLINYAATTDSVIKENFKSVAAVNLKDNKNNTTTKISNTIKKNKTKPLVVVVAKNNGEYLGLEKLNERFDDNHVLFVDGGGKALESYIRSKASMMNKKTFNLQDVKGCPN